MCGAQAPESARVLKANPKAA